MQISSVGKSLLCPSKWVQRGPNKMASPFCPFTIQVALTHCTLLKILNCINILHCVNNASLKPIRDAVKYQTDMREIIHWRKEVSKGKKVNFLLFFPFVCLRKDVSWGERKTQVMLELLHPAYYSAAPALCPQAFLRLTILTTPVICGPVILPLCSAFFRRLQGLLTGPVCHAGWGWIWGWGWGGGRFRLGWMVRVGQARAGVILEGRVVMSLRQCRAIRTLHGFFRSPVRHPS